MKVLMLCGILLSVIVHPTHAALTPEDLDKIRLIVKEEIQPLEAQVRKVEENVARLEGRMTGIEQRFDGIEQQIAHTTYITYALIALIVIAVGIPQMLIASRWRKAVRYKG